MNCRRPYRSVDLAWLNTRDVRQRSEIRLLRSLLSRAYRLLLVAVNFGGPERDPEVDRFLGEVRDVLNEDVRRAA